MNSQIEHHGVIGMRWGVRKADKLNRREARRERSRDSLRTGDRHTNRYIRSSMRRMKKMNPDETKQFMRKLEDMRRAEILINKRERVLNERQINKAEKAARIMDVTSKGLRTIGVASDAANSVRNTYEGFKSGKYDHKQDHIGKFFNDTLKNTEIAIRNTNKKKKKY